MARVAVLHNTLDFQGGADAVCLRTCEALARDHDVTLFTLSTTDPLALAERFGVDIDGLDVRHPPGNDAIAGAFSRLAPIVGPALAARSVLLRRYVRPFTGEFDLAVSTANELALALPSVQYVHFPQFRAGRSPDGKRAGPFDRAADACLSHLGAPSPTTLAAADTVLLANSAWTADVVAERYGVRPSVLHPPVPPIPCERSWPEREDGFVFVGRLAPDKRALEAIRVVERLRQRGHDLHLHVVGTAPPAYRRYAGRVADAAAARPWVSLERDATRQRLETLLCSHKYGLNMKKREHFGMAVAEYVAAGMVAFAPDSGGQREILEGRGDRLFDSVADAVETIARAVEADDRPSLPSDRFSVGGFAEGVRRAAEQAID